MGFKIIPESECTKKIATANGRCQIQALPAMTVIRQPHFTVLPQNPVGASMYYIQPVRAFPVWDDTGNASWQLEAEEIYESNGRQDPLYQEKHGVLCGITAAGKDVELTNFTIKLLKKIINYVSRGQDAISTYIIEIDKTDDNQQRFLEIDEAEFGNLGRVVRKKYPELFISNKMSDSFSKYLADVAADDADVSVEKNIWYRGWTDITGELIYSFGTGKLFDKINKSLQESVFKAGFGFLKVGDYSPEIIVIWLYAHFPYVAYFFEQAGYRLQSVLFIRGITGSLKTSVAKELANVFETDQSKKMLTFGSTEAATLEKIEAMTDQTILIDDFSNSEKTKTVCDNRLFERIIRVLGDGAAPSKMGSDRKIVQRFIRTSAIITGEDDPALSLSSMLRCITVTVGRESFDGKKLLPFQQQPEIMRDYFMMFIHFLQENAEKVVNQIKNAVPIYRAQYKQEFKADRFADAAVNLRILADIIADFASWTGSYEYASEQFVSFEKKIIEVLKKNQTERESLSITSMYLIGIMQSIDTEKGLGLANSEASYVVCPSNYIGFEDTEDGRIWLDHKKAYKLVCSYWQGLAQSFTSTPKTIHQRLADEKIVVHGKTGFLQRAKKGQRQYMLVLDKNAIEKILEDKGEL
ncbi:hypothetical protein [Pectinatus haikarae]|uniref:DUF927 domain-containing protein n=1 Tax=Pectinatus haikarae TaxID=349096 RepID=A0ABT9Y4T7_9FIRM|nr:hypothetical protein [Pectinatus haikarae]MDQ0202840.1 hypothetical protein [Pectinatus haikarae]